MQLTKLSQQVATAQSAEKTAKYVADKQQAVVNADQANVNAKATEVADAQKSVDAAKAALNGSSASEVASNQSKAQSDLMLQLQLRKRPKKNWQSLRQLIRKRLLLFHLKKGN